MIIAITFCILGFALLIKGADFLVNGASNIAKKFHIPEIIIGLTIVSIGTSLPELFISVISSVQGHADMSVGNIIGSNITNLLLILGLSAVLQPIEFKKETRMIEIPLCLFITFQFLLICNIEQDINRNDAMILISLLIAFIIYTITRALKGEENNLEQYNNNSDLAKNSNFKNIIYIIIGIIGLKFGGDLTVDNAVIIAKYFNLSEKIIGLTIISIGTSLPELITSIFAAIKKKSDIAIGNIIGSNIFNILLILGVSANINPIKYNIAYNFDMIVLLIATLLLVVFSYIPPKNKLTKRNGIIYLSLYIVYITMLFTK